MLLVTDDDGALRALDFDDYESRMHRLLRLHYRTYVIEDGPRSLALTRALTLYSTAISTPSKWSASRPAARRFNARSGRRFVRPLLVQPRATGDSPHNLVARAPAAL